MISMISYEHISIIIYHHTLIVELTKNLPIIAIKFLISTINLKEKNNIPRRIIKFR